MRKLSTILMAVVLVLGLTQCKKETPANSENEGGKVSITLDVENHGNKHVVDPGATQATVTYKNGDVIYVGDGKTYLGILKKRGDGGNFSGSINTPAEGTKNLHFYFIGSLTVAKGDTVRGTTASFTYDISNQSGQLPVLSYATAPYTGAASYSCELQNQCGLAEFTLGSDAGTVVVGGMQTVAVINFASPGISGNSTIGGITLNNTSSGKTKYAILLPQGEVSNAAVTVDGTSGYKATVPTISANDFKKEIAITN